MHIRAFFYLNLNGIKYERKSEKDPGRSTCSKMTSSCKCLQMQIVQMFIFSIVYWLIQPPTYNNVPEWSIFSAQ